MLCSSDILPGILSFAFAVGLFIFLQPHWRWQRLLHAGDIKKYSDAYTNSHTNMYAFMDATFVLSVTFYIDCMLS